MLKAIDVIEKVAPKAKKEYLKAIKEGQSLIEKAGITTPLRLSHFLAQILHESMGLTVTQENMNYRAARIMTIFGVGRHSAKITKEEANYLAGKPYALAERVYGLGNPKKAKELGNTKIGDGFKYRGGGILQTTGGGAYKKCGDKVGVDFYNNPELVYSSEHALKPALYEWTLKNCNAAADVNDIGLVTKKINGGSNGLKDRQEWFNKVYKIVSKGEEAFVKAKPDNTLKFVQESLNELGVAEPALNIDGKLGPKTVAAIKKFQKLNKLPVDGSAGPITIEAIKQTLATNKNIPIEPDESMLSSTITKGSIAGLAVGGTEVVKETQDVIEQISDIKNTADSIGFLDIIHYIWSNPWLLMSIVILIIFCYILYRRWKMRSERGV